MVNGASPTGGFTTVSGRSVLVTPEGVEVGSARRGGGGGGGGGLTTQEDPKVLQRRRREIAQQLRDQKAAEARDRIATIERRQERAEKVIAGTISGQLRKGDIPLDGPFPLASDRDRLREGRETGILSLSEGERREFGAPSTPFIVADTGQTPGSAARLSGFLPDIAPLLPGPVQPEASLRKGREDILEAQQTAGVVEQFRSDPEQFEGSAGVTVEETDFGRTFTAGPEFFEGKIDRGSIERQASRDIFDRPKGDIILGRFLEVGVGAAGLGIGAAEFTTDLASQFGVQTIEKGVEKKGVRFGGILGDIRAQERGVGTFLGGALVATPAIGLGFSGFATAVKAQGFKTAVGETVTGFSPFKIPTQTFGALETARGIKNLKFDTVSFKSSEGGITSRITLGRGRGSPDVSLIAKEGFITEGGSSVGGRTIDIIAPRTTFQLGKFGEGQTALKFEEVFLGRGGPATISKDVKPQADLLQFFRGEGGKSFVKDSFPLKIEGVSTKLGGIEGGFSESFVRQVSRVSADPIRSSSFFTPDAPFIRGVGGSISETLGPGITRSVSGPGKIDVGPRTKGRKQSEFELEISPQLKLDGLDIGFPGSKLGIRDITSRGAEFDVRALKGKDPFSGFGARSPGPRRSGPSRKGGPSQVTQSPEVVQTTDIPSFGIQGLKATDIIKPVTSKDIGLTPIAQAGDIGAAFGRPSAFQGGGQFEVTSGRAAPGLSPLDTTDLFQPGPALSPPIGRSATGRGLDFGVTPAFSPAFGAGLDFDRPTRGRGRGVGTRTIIDQLGGQAEGVNIGVAFSPALASPSKSSQDFFSPQLPGRGTSQGFDIFGGAGVGFGFGLPPIGGLPSERPERRRRTKGRKRRIGRIAPSLTGITAFDISGITGDLPSPKGGRGVNPFEIRFVPDTVRKKSKSKSKKRSIKKKK